MHLQICLEHSFHLLLHGHIEDAKRQLSVSESWRHGKESAAQLQWTRLIQAYRSLLDYIIWCDKKFTHSTTGKVIHILTPKASIIYLYLLCRHAASCSVMSHCHLQVRLCNYSSKKWLGWRKPVCVCRLSTKCPLV